MLLGASFLNTMDMVGGVSYHSGFAAVPGPESHEAVLPATHWLHVDIFLNVRASFVDSK